MIKIYPNYIYTHTYDFPPLRIGIAPQKKTVTINVLSALDRRPSLEFKTQRMLEEQTKADFSTKMATLNNKNSSTIPSTLLNLH